MLYVMASTLSIWDGARRISSVVFYFRTLHYTLLTVAVIKVGGECLSGSWRGDLTVFVKLVCERH